MLSSVSLTIADRIGSSASFCAASLSALKSSIMDAIAVLKWNRVSISSDLNAFECLSDNRRPHRVVGILLRRIAQRIEKLHNGRDCRIEVEPSLDIFRSECFRVSL